MGEAVPLAVVIAACSALIAVLALGWGIWSWRMTGSSIRVHAFLYGDVLLIRAFNAGRTADTIEQLVLGGTRGGSGGHDLTGHIGGPVRLEVGQSARWVIDPGDLPPSRTVSARRGWDNLWLLLGSMRQRRAEVLPLPQDNPPAVGWRLAPRRARLSRYTPLAAAAAVLAAPSGWTTAAQVLIAATIAVVTVRAYASFIGDQASHRVRTERWTTALGLGLAVLLAARAQPDAEPIGAAGQAAVAVYVVSAALLAIPGGVARLRDEAVTISRNVRERLARRRAEQQGVPSGSTDHSDASRDAAPGGGAGQ